MFKITDVTHDEYLPGEYATEGEAMAELRRLADLPWDVKPNRAPCKQWETCSRDYEIVEVGKKVTYKACLKVGSAGVRWMVEEE